MAYFLFFKHRTVCVRCNATKKSSKKDLFPEILKGALPATAFSNLNLTTSNSQLIDEIQSDLGLTPQTITRRAAGLGAGILKYEGNEWSNGAIFVGKNASGRYIITFLGIEGFKILEDNRNNQELVRKFQQMTVTQISAFLTTTSDPNYRNGEEWIKGAGTSIINCSPSKTLVYLDKNSLKVGKKGGNKVLEIKPFNPGGKENSFSKVLIKAFFSGSTAEKLFATLLNVTNKPENVLAFAVYDALDKFKISDDLLDSFKISLNSDFKIGTVVQNEPVKNVAISKELKSTKAACTSIVNKIVMSSYTEQVFILLKENLFKVMKERKSEIQNYSVQIKELQDFMKEDDSKPL